jgi:hypothetical protein
MLTLLLSAIVSSAVPTPADVLLDTPTPAELTRVLLAQAATQAEEEKNLENDMDRARQHVGDEPANKDAAKPAVAPAAGTSDTAPEDQEKPKRKHRHHHEDKPEKFRALSEDGHGKGYYLSWGIVDWTLAGGLWIAATVLTVAGLTMLSVRSLADCHERYGAGSCNQGMSQFHNSGIVVTGLGLAFGAGGGIAAWRAGTNIGSFRDLRAIERERREGER